VLYLFLVLRPCVLLLCDALEAAANALQTAGLALGLRRRDHRLLLIMLLGRGPVDLAGVALGRRAVYSAVGRAEWKYIGLKSNAYNSESNYKYIKRTPLQKRPP
jgi:hypothetical protein